MIAQDSRREALRRLVETFEPTFTARLLRRPVGCVRAWLDAHAEIPDDADEQVRRVLAYWG